MMRRGSALFARSAMVQAHARRAAASLRRLRPASEVAKLQTAVRPGQALPGKRCSALGPRVAVWLRQPRGRKCASRAARGRAGDNGTSVPGWEAGRRRRPAPREEPPCQRRLSGQA